MSALFDNNNKSVSFARLSVSRQSVNPLSSSSSSQSLFHCRSVCMPVSVNCLHCLCLSGCRAVNLCVKSRATLSRALYQLACTCSYTPIVPGVGTREHGATSWRQSLKYHQCLVCLRPCTESVMSICVSIYNLMCVCVCVRDRERERERERDREREGEREKAGRQADARARAHTHATYTHSHTQIHTHTQ